MAPKRGRPFEPKNPGKRKGTRDKVPRGYVVAAYRRFFEEDGNVERFQQLVRRMALDPDYAMPLIRDMADRLDGKAAETLTLKGELPAVTIILLGEHREALPIPPSPAPPKILEGPVPP